MLNGKSKDLSKVLQMDQSQTHRDILANERERERELN